MKIVSYAYVAATILFTVYGQIIVKLRITRLQHLSEGSGRPPAGIIDYLLDPLILSGFGAAFLAALAWIMALRSLDLSHAYPFMSLNFVVVLLLSGWMLGESVSPMKVLGVALIVAGTIVASRG